MKGVVFIAINDMIEERYGIETWEQLLDDVNPECEGIYTSTQDYPDEEVVLFVKAISQKLNVPPTDVTRLFGQFLFGELNNKYEIFTKLSTNLFDFLASIENVIHKEVRKLYHSPSLPTLHCEPYRDSLKMRYSSPRKLCYLAEGLIFGAAEHYNETISIRHDKCMHDGHPECEIWVDKHAEK